VSDPWVAAAVPGIMAHVERELEALVGVSSPSGDVRGAEEAVAIVVALLPAPIEVERVPCSSPGHAPDLIARLRGDGRRRLLLLGHLDTVVAHDARQPLARQGDRLTGSGAIDMKGGVALALGVLRALAATSAGARGAVSAAGEAPPDGTPRFAEVAVLLVNDEEWRRHPFVHAEAFDGWDACLCFEAGERGPNGEEAVVVRRKAAGTLRIEAHGASAHSGSAPDRGRNALLALAAAAERVAAFHDPDGPARLSAVPTVLHSGEAFNVVPASGEVYCDLRADRLDDIEAVTDAIPAEIGGARLEGGFVRRWPGMDARAATRDLLSAGAARLGRPIVGTERGGASDASHFAPRIELTVDGLGPRGGAAHAPEEYVLADSLESRAEVALALVAALLDERAD
jgi:glutamate carboxypeptidase